MNKYKFNLNLILINKYEIKDDSAVLIALSTLRYSDLRLTDVVQPATGGGMKPKTVGNLSLCQRAKTGTNRERKKMKF